MNYREFYVSLDGCGYIVSAVHRHVSEMLVFFIHGLGCSSSSFRHIWNDPALAGYSLLAVDLLGFGRSSKPEDDFSYSMEDQALVCSQVLEQVSFQKLHIVAHSMGGAIGLLLPQQLLAEVESLCNVEGNLTAADCGFASRRSASVSFAHFQAEVLPELTRKFAGYGALEEASPDAFYRSAKSLVYWSDSGELLQQFLTLFCRKSYFYGDENRLSPGVSATRDVLQIEIAGSGHFPMIDNPQEFSRRLGEFLCAGQSPGQRADEV